MKKIGFKLVPIVLVALLALPAAAQAKEAGDSVTKGKGQVKEKSSQSSKMNAQWSRFGVLEWDDQAEKIKDTNPNFDYELATGEDYRDLVNGKTVKLNVINRGGNIVKTINYPLNSQDEVDEGEEDAATGVTSIVKPVWSGSTSNAANVNRFMDSLWKTDSVFAFTDGKLVVNMAKITPEMLTFIKTNWGGSSVPVKLIPDGIAEELVKDANWSNSYVDWMGLAGLEHNGEVKRTIGGITYTIKYIGENDVATGVRSIVKPVWSGATPNAANVNRFMDSLWNANSVFEFTNGKLVIDIDEITPEMLTFIETNWGGSSVPVKLNPNGTVVGLAKDANWSNSYLDWMGLSGLKYNGEVERTIGGITYTIKYVGGTDLATDVRSIEQPEWTNERTANADEVNEFMESLWEPNSVFEFTNEKLVVDIDEITPDMLTFIDTNWGGSSVPVKLIPDGPVIGLAKDANWDNSYLDWIRLSRLKYNGEVERTIGGITYTIKYVGGINR